MLRFVSGTAKATRCYYALPLRQMAKQAKSKKSGHSVGSSSHNETPVSDFDTQKYFVRMQHAVDKIARDLAGLRLGRASPGKFSGEIIFGASFHLFVCK